MPEKMSRRTVLSILTAGLGALWSGAVAALAAVYVTTPLRKTQAIKEARLGSASLAGKEFRRVNVEIPIKDGWHERFDYLTVFVRENEEGAPIVLSGTCPHLGCTVGWNSEAQEFRCPCHAGRFAPDGSVLSGPPPGPLAQLKAEVRDGHIFVTLEA